MRFPTLVKQMSYECQTLTHVGHRDTPTPRGVCVKH